ncbi:MAG: extracellular solute-binding protein [Deltaproteobacteria bacterium]|nr:extracellular solute-binding protein [Deltaproteobacteria bacterium]
MKIRTAAILIIVLHVFSMAWGHGAKGASLAELAGYTGADREQKLIAGARSEGKAVWYTSLAGSSYKEIAKAFEAKYPGVKVEIYRGTSQDLMAKISAEAQAKRFLVDAVETTLPLLRVMREDGLLTPYTSPHLAKYPEEAKEKGDKGLLFWAIDRESYIGVAFNKNSIASTAAPKSYEDLLRPEFKGRLGLATSDTGPRTIGAMLTFKGEEFLKKLKGQEVSLHSLSARALLDQVVSGEVGASPTIFRSHASEMMKKGAPVSWAPMEVVPTNAGGVVLAAGAPHPHAAILLVDFILGPEAQRILEKLEYGNADKDYGFKRWYPEKGLTTAQYDKENTRWEKMLRELGRK